MPSRVWITLDTNLDQLEYLTADEGSNAPILFAVPAPTQLMSDNVGLLNVKYADTEF